MFTFPDYNYNRYAYNMRRPQPSHRSSFYNHPALASMVYSPFENDYTMVRARHQQQKEEERRKRMQRQQAFEERQRQRQLYEREARDEEKRQRTTNANVQTRANTSGLPFPPGTILRGRDGRLYRVVDRPSCLREPTSYEDTKADDSTSLCERSDIDNVSCSSDSSMDKAHIDVEDINNLHSEKNLHVIKVTPTDDTDSIHSVEKEKNTPNNRKTSGTLTLVVEDVPIDEDEELRDLHSVWRNRVPSPGQWMEPIDNFDKQ